MLVKVLPSPGNALATTRILISGPPESAFSISGRLICR